MAERAPIPVALAERDDPQRTPVAACELHTEAGRGPLICRLARRLVALGIDPETPLDVRRNGRPVFARAYPFRTWARLTVAERDRCRFERYVPREGAETATQHRAAGTTLPEAEDAAPAAIPGIGGAR